MENNEQKLLEILQILNNEGALENSILIGSWCLFFYKYIFDNFEPTIRTTDIDFLVPQPKSFKEKSGIAKTLKEINYFIVQDTLTNKTIFISPDGFEIEFLTKLTRSQSPCVKLGNTVIHAESLPYVDIFASNYVEVNFHDILVRVASPASYVIQKLLINNERGEKKEKDIDSIRHVLIYLFASKTYTEEFLNLIKNLPKKWKRKIQKTSVENGLNINFNL